MRVRITTQPTGTIDGVDLSKLIEDRIYDVGASLATLLIVSNWATPVLDERPSLVVPIDHPIVELIPVPMRDTGDDRPPRRRRRSRR